MKLFDIKSKNYYFVNGLRRSGNHFFISWIISNYKRVLFINDVNCKPIIDKKYHLKELETKICYKENNYFVDSINNNLISNREDIFTIDDIDCLIFSMEDKTDETFYKTIKYFNKIIHKRPVSKYFKAIVIRDLLNLMGSRLEGIKNLKNDNRTTKSLKVDRYVIDVWMNMNNDKKSVLFNYNKFILNIGNYRDDIGKKINLPTLSDDVLLKVPQFFFGSSFNPNSQSRAKINDLLNRYKSHQNNKFILEIVNNENLMSILSKDYLISYKIAYLFLIKKDINNDNDKIWNQYFNNNDNKLINKFTIYSFSKDPTEIKSFLKYYSINKYTGKSNNLLHRHAIKDDILNKYFIILHDNDIPKMSFNIFYKYLINKFKTDNKIKLLESDIQKFFITK